MNVDHVDKIYLRGKFPDLLLEESPVFDANCSQAEGSTPSHDIKFKARRRLDSLLIAACMYMLY